MFPSLEPRASLLSSPRVESLQTSRTLTCQTYPTCLPSEQYNAYPYPPRDPRRRAPPSAACHFGRPAGIINHHCFGGAKDFRKGFRALVAGGGTGDTAIFLAEQLRHCDCTVVYLDMSTTTRQVAEARAEVRGLTNITWMTASIMETAHRLRCRQIRLHRVLRGLASPRIYRGGSQGAQIRAEG